ncbi:MAG: ActR/PrrA/RegA family redox response regulator transcription factor [Rhodospirillales bacterium]|nr:ActR/PrrA/RegA family redox response regulator transcription factor [Rhodospirillales bacterium]
MPDRKTSFTAEVPSEERSLLIVDDDEPFRQRLATAMERRGFATITADGIGAALAVASQNPPAYAVIDLRLADGNGLELVPLLRQVSADTRVVMLTGYGNIASAVFAIKSGAVDYLAKPVDADRLTAVLLGWDDSTAPEPSEAPMSAQRVRWEYIHRIYEECGGNISETARRLKMHRRTVQRILGKHAPME